MSVRHSILGYALEGPKHGAVGRGWLDPVMVEVRPSCDEEQGGSLPLGRTEIEVSGDSRDLPLHGTMHGFGTGRSGSAWPDGDIVRSQGLALQSGHGCEEANHGQAGPCSCIPVVTLEVLEI